MTRRRGDSATRKLVSLRSRSSFHSRLVFALSASPHRVWRSFQENTFAGSSDNWLLAPPSRAPLPDTGQAHDQSLGPEKRNSSPHGKLRNANSSTNSIRARVDARSDGIR